MRSVPGTDYIKKINNGKYIINKKINGETICFGIYDNLNKAIHYRDYFQCKGWDNCINERLNYSDTYKDKDYTMRYISQIKSTGNYQISKKINGKNTHFGTYTNLDDALFWRDYFEENNWNTHDRLFYSKSKYIKKLPSGKYMVLKQSNGTQISYGTFDTLNEAEHQVLLCKRFQWDKNIKPFDCMKYIHKIELNDGSIRYQITRWTPEGLEYYGKFKNLDDAKFERDILMMCGWDIELACEFDETLTNGDEWLNNKYCKGNILYQPEMGRIDYDAELIP